MKQFVQFDVHLYQEQEDVSNLNSENKKDKLVLDITPEEQRKQ